MTQTIVLRSPKGGQGCSAVAVALALTAGGPTLLVDANGGDAARILNLPPSTYGLPVSFAPNRDMIQTSHVHALALLTNDEYDFAIVDAGTSETVFPGRQLMVVRNCFLAASRLLAHTKPYDAIIMVAEPGRTLTCRDLEQVTGHLVIATVPFDCAIARYVDAGMFNHSVPRLLARALSHVLV